MLAYFVLLASVLAVSAQSSTVCSKGLCFEEFQFVTDDGSATMGFAFPHLPSLGARATSVSSDEFIFSISFPMPYGFAAFSMDETKFPMRMTAFDPFRPNNSMPEATSPTKRSRPLAADLPMPQTTGLPFGSVAPVDVSDFVAQFSKTLPNNTLAPFGDAITTLSPLSTADDAFTNLIFHCQGCALPDSSREVSMLNPDRMSITVTATLSDNMPEYLGPFDPKAMLPMQGADEMQFTLNLAAARFPEYEKFLKAAGFTQ